MSTQQPDLRAELELLNAKVEALQLALVVVGSMARSKPNVGVLLNKIDDLISHVPDYRRKPEAWKKELKAALREIHGSMQAPPLTD